MYKTLKLQKSLFDEKIIEHFEKNYEEEREDYEFNFIFRNLGETFRALVMYRVEDWKYSINQIEGIQVIDSLNNHYSIGSDDERHELNRLVLENKVQDPNKPTVYAHIWDYCEIESENNY
jgi:hypothetical protein